MAVSGRSVAGRSRVGCPATSAWGPGSWRPPPRATGAAGVAVVSPVRRGSATTSHSRCAPARKGRLVSSPSLLTTRRPTPVEHPRRGPPAGSGHLAVRGAHLVQPRDLRLLLGAVGGPEHGHLVLAVIGIA